VHGFQGGPVGAAQQQLDTVKAIQKPKQKWNDADQGALIVDLSNRLSALQAQLNELKTKTPAQGDTPPGFDPTELEARVQANTDAIQEVLKQIGLLSQARVFLPELEQEIEVNGGKHTIRMKPIKFRYTPLTGLVEVTGEHNRVLDSDTYEPGAEVSLRLKVQ
jgi:hypothetical protein